MRTAETTDECQWSPTVAFLWQRPCRLATLDAVQTLGTSAISEPVEFDLVAQLAAIESALERGDLVAARRTVEQVRRSFARDVPAASERFQVVGGVDLTDRERATLLRLTDGSMSQKDIARDLAVSPNTVKTHLKSIYQKLGVHCRGEAIHRARELGLLPEPLAPAIPLHRP
jgi:ATP/maltotriose-dependent transcriptional regulator MalT